MRALEELPEQEKDAILPIFPLKPWQSAGHLDSTLSRIEDAYGNRPFFVDIEEPEIINVRRPVHDEIEEILTPNDGYANWCRYVEDRPTFIPTVQLASVEELAVQTARLFALGRGLLVPIRPFAFGALADIARTVAGLTEGGRDVCILLDFGRGNRDLLGRQAEATGFVLSILREAPGAVISLSASSFPDGFVGLEEQDIFERQLFDGVRIHAPEARLIYSDRGSARAERQSGGGGTPSPRIDYAERHRWTFFRDETGVDPEHDEDERRAHRVDAYIQQASALTTSGVWDPNLAIWGTQMIQRTALGDVEAINSPVRATAARINIHLHRQLFYDDPAAIYDTDEDWTD